MEKKIHKKEYAPPVLRVSEFRVEHGFAASNITFGIGSTSQTEEYQEGNFLGWGVVDNLGTESYGDGGNIGW